MSGAGPAEAALAIRPATLEDLALVLRQRRAMFEEMGHRDAPRLDAMQAVAAPFFAQGLRDGSYRGFFVVASTGEVAAGGGVLLLRYQPHPADASPRRPFIVNLYTEPCWRRQGHARRLLEAMIGWCRSQGFASVYLHASDEGRPLYAALGFEPTSEMRLRLLE